MNTVTRKLISLTNQADAELGAQRMRRSPQRNLHNILWERASQQSADFVETHLGEALVFQNKRAMWNYSAQLLRERSSSGTCLEFGVGGGTSINWLSKLLPNFRFVGFDSFLGLKEDWYGHHAAKGAYSRDGLLPRVSSNVSLVAGWFEETIPAYVSKNGLTDLVFIHIDSDTYGAAVNVLTELGGFIKPGTHILFDEFLGYPNWQNGEFKAFQEARERFGFELRYRAFSSEQALIEITS